MKIRRILATAVVAAVTTPAVLLSVTPAFADGKPAAQTQEKPSVAELKKAAAAAQAAYDDAVAAESAAYAAMEAIFSATDPAVVAAQAAAAEAATAKTEADQAVVDATTALDELKDTATDAERAAAEAALTEAETAATAADAAKADADAELAAALEARDDERVAAARAYDQAKKATKAALADKTAADETLAKAEEEAEEDGEGDGDCIPEAKLTTVVKGLPSTVVAGTKVNFKLRVTNGTDETMDEVFPFAYVHATDRSGLNDLDDLVHLQWSPASSSKWKNVDNEHYMDPISPLKAGAHTDVKMRLTIDASAPAGNGVTFVAGDYWNDNGTCGGSPDLEGYEFVIAAAGSKPGKVDDAKTGTSKPNTSDLKPQSGTSASPVSGSLAATGSSSTSQLALASGAALAMGAGAMFVVRRRKAGSHA
ncbi:MULTISPECIES: LPXTG cell wall anchor domain-containing protein [Streptomyces]|uniref:LPXTG cell wall anchor domain-containing protein n=1 Tax=Streptomyces mutomycini TaxID=284036 RepID=A0ABW0BAX6_9ACTN|nr:MULTISPECIES: LPXTG cell wall anchor domain-containing protein [Streptomyces]